MTYTLITGATTGIGCATAENLAESGFSDLLLVGRNNQALMELRDRLRLVCDKQVDYLSTDLTNLSDMQSLKDWFAGENIAINLVNAAGIGRFGDTDKLTMDDFDAVFATNVRALFELTQCFVGQSLARNMRKRVINVSSDADSVGFPDASIYCASKGAVRGLSLAWQTELREKNVMVCNLSPGRVDTNFNGKKPGMRIGALSASDVAEVICFVLQCSENIEISQISIDSMSR